LTNLVPVQASADAVNLPEPVEFILLVDTYHHIRNRIEYFARLKSSLRHAGRLAIVDFKADSPSGPPAQHRVLPEKVTQELNAAGYSLIESFEFLPRQYFLIFQKRGCANKIARMAWAMMARGERYREPVALAA
jgi:hypothetical protein